MRVKTKKIVIGICIIVFVFFALNRLFFFTFGFWEKFGIRITYPVLWLTSVVATNIKEAGERKESYEHLHQKYSNIKKKYLDVLAENITLKAMLHYDQLSKDLREFQERYNLSNMILTKILVKNITNDEHYFLVSKGINDGIKKDMIATYKFQLVGKVVDVYDNYSKVILITDQQCKVAAYVNQTNAQGIVRGQNIIDRCNLSYVSHLFNVVDNDLVLSSGQGLIFPEGFCLGKILSHELKEKALYHEIEVEPLVSLQNIDFCLISYNTITNQSQKPVPNDH